MHPSTIWHRAFVAQRVISSGCRDFCFLSALYGIGKICHSGRNTLSSLLKRRSLRAVTIWLLALMQMHLLLVLVFHHHYVPEFALAFSSTTTRTTVKQADKDPLPPISERDFCTGCQILRHGAIRPALGSPAAQRLTVSPLLAVRAAVLVPFTQPVSLHGRAPPLV